MKMPQKPPAIYGMPQHKIEGVVKAMHNEAYQTFSRVCEKDYLPWEEIRHKAPQGIDPVVAWALVKLGRQQRYRQVPLHGKRDVNLCFNLPDVIQHELMMIDQQLAGHLNADDDNPLSAQQRDKFIVSALQEEAIASSMLEGAATTRRDARRMLETGRKPRDRSEQMVLNNYQAILFIQEHRHARLSRKFLLELQATLTHDTMDNPDEVGRFRTQHDQISIVDQRDNEIIHDPPPANELDDRIERLCRFANGEDDTGFIHPVIRACIIHFQIGYDHPFCDGNGRTARALFYWFMLRHGYWLFEYLPISRFIYNSPVQYTRSYLHTEIDDFDLTYFLMYQIGIFKKARAKLRDYLHQKKQQLVDARKMFDADTRLNHRQLELLIEVARNPERYIVIADYQRQQKVTYQTARTDLLSLHEWDYLNMVKRGKRLEFAPGPMLDRMKSHD